MIFIGELRRFIKKCKILFPKWLLRNITTSSRSYLLWKNCIKQYSLNGMSGNFWQACWPIRICYKWYTISSLAILSLGAFFMLDVFYYQEYLIPTIYLNIDLLASITLQTNLSQNWFIAYWPLFCPFWFLIITYALLKRELYLKT